MKKTIFNIFLFVTVFVGVFSAPFLITGETGELQKLFSMRNLSAKVLEAAEQKNAILGEEELVNLIKPATVRIAQRMKGEAIIPAFTIDLKKLEIRLIPGGKPTTIPIDTALTGSGSIVSPDGYILTNAHVASDKVVIIETIAKTASIVMLSEILDMGEEGIEIIENMDKDVSEAFGRKILEFLESKSTFNMEKQELVVLDPSSRKENFEDLIDDGFPAEIEYANDNFIYDDKDIALIKISVENLPAISLSKTSSVSVGEKIYAFGFPASAELGGSNFLEATFTKGVVSALKDSQNGDFKVIQTDAKVSQGSSGGAMFNKLGEIVGLITFQTSIIGRKSGDSFAFAIPASISSEAFNKARFVPREDNYSLRLKNGINLLSQKKCEKALVEFEIAKDVNQNFSVDEYVDGYIEECNNLIAAGLSIDTRLDEFFEWLKATNYAIIVIGGAALVIIILIIVIISMSRRGSRRDSEIDSLEERFEKQDATRINNGPHTGSLPPSTVMSKPIQPKQQIPTTPKPQPMPVPVAPVPKPPVAPLRPQPKPVAPAPSTQPILTTPTPVHPTLTKPVIPTPTPQQPVQPSKILQPEQPLQQQPTQQTPDANFNPKLMQYTRNLKNIGFSDNEIVENLTKDGFEESQIRKSLKA